MATLAAAEMFRILFELFRWQREVDGDLVGPDGTQGFRGIRWVFEAGVEPGHFLVLVWLLLALVLAGFLVMERSRLGAVLRATGEDPDLAGALGLDVVRLKLGAAAAAGALAALGGALFAHHNTYIEPRNFDIMLGVHSLAYALIGGRGYVLPEDLKALVEPVFAHRVLLSPDAQLRGVTAAEVLNDAVRSVPVPLPDNQSA